MEWEVLKVKRLLEEDSRCRLSPNHEFVTSGNKYLEIEDRTGRKFVFTIATDEDLLRYSIAFSPTQRQWAKIRDVVTASPINVDRIIMEIEFTVVRKKTGEINALDMITLDSDKMAVEINNQLQGRAFSQEEKLSFSFPYKKNNDFTLTVNTLQGSPDPENEPAESIHVGKLHSKTRITFVTEASSLITLTGERIGKSQYMADFDSSKLGVGGLDQIEVEKVAEKYLTPAECVQLQQTQAMLNASIASIKAILEQHEGNAPANNPKKRILYGTKMKGKRAQLKDAAGTAQAADAKVDDKEENLPASVSNTADATSSAVASAPTAEANKEESESVECSYNEDSGSEESSSQEDDESPGNKRALAGLPMFVAHEEDEVDFLSQEAEAQLHKALESIKKNPEGFYVQAATLGSLNEVIEFFKSENIPYSNVNIGPVRKRDVQKAAVFKEQSSNTEFACILAFDVCVEKEAQQFADNEGVKIIQAHNIYSLKDNFLKYREELRHRAN